MWIKLDTSFRNDAKIKHLRRQPNGDTLALIWVMLLSMAGDINDGGLIYIAPGVPYDADSLADDLDCDPADVARALELFEVLGMIARTEDGLQLINWGKHQAVEKMDKIREQNRKRVAQHRARITCNASDSITCNADCSVTKTHAVTLCNATDKDKDIDIDISTPVATATVVDTRERARDGGNDVAANPFADSGDARPAFDTPEAYAAANLLPLSPGNMAELADFKTTFPADVLRYAVDVAVGQGVRKWSYVRAILAAWQDAGVRTLGAAQAESDKRHRKKQANSPPPEAWENPWEVTANK